MKIIHVTDTSIYNYDGISTYINELLLCSEQQGHETLVLTTTPYGTNIREYGKSKTKIKIFPSVRFPGKPKFVTVFTFGMKKIIDDFNPDIVWIHSIGTPGMRAAKIADGKYRIIYTKHCFDGVLWNSYLNINPAFHWFFNFWAGKFENKILRSADEVIYHLRDVSPVKNNKYFNKFIFSPPPLAAAFFENKKDKTKVNGKLTLGFCGRCEPDKGLEDTLKGLQLFHEKHKDIELEFIMIGDGPEAHRLKDKYDFLKITITGYINDVIPYLDKLDGFVLSSIHEMISLSSLEAYARGIPIFSVPIGYLQESSSTLNNFYLFETHEQLAELVFKILVKQDIPVKTNSVNGLNSLVISYPDLYKSRASYPRSLKKASYS